MTEESRLKEKGGIIGRNPIVRLCQRMKMEVHKAVCERACCSLIHTPTSISRSVPSLSRSLSQIESGDLPETIPDNHT